MTTHQGNHQRGDLLFVHLLLKQDEREEGAQCGVEGRDDGRVGRANVVDGNDVARHADGAAEKGAQHDDLAAPGLERGEGVLEAALGAHVEHEPDCGARACRKELAMAAKAMASAVPM